MRDNKWWFKIGAALLAVLSLLWAVDARANGEQQCPKGVDPVYCQLANATGGSVVACHEGTDQERAACMLEAVKNLKPQPNTQVEQEKNPVPWIEHFIYRGHKRNAWDQNLNVWMRGALLPSSVYVLMQWIVLGMVMLGWSKKALQTQVQGAGNVHVLIKPLLVSTAITTGLTMLPAALLGLLPHGSGDEALLVVQVALMTLCAWGLLVGAAIALLYAWRGGSQVQSKVQWWAWLSARTLLGCGLFVILTLSVSLSIGPLYFRMALY